MRTPRLPTRTTKALLSVLVAAVTLAACTSKSKSKGECSHSLETGVFGQSMRASDTDHEKSPGNDETILVFRGDDLALAQPGPLDPEKPPEGPGIPKQGRIAVPLERVTTPVATTKTDAEGCFELELPAGHYVISEPQSLQYVQFRVSKDERTHCSKLSGYRFVNWSCGG